ncbi:endonuclease/exonuclease/phosphatase family protein [Streptomyces mayonensis]|uniref:endonuclease/exonuclease/phosphatase family protein n=1 Tax=Streptomyces mayonensis TaxID=2750816 RepID=UPI001C1E47F3|nr:endonuclease/exonuclease/phosphatase family protein [Streptomyces sp. A108]MBU6532986.1 endonuclease/exonuclease/phosphatase family protein [Streptomyces sp. A108]
MRTGALLGLLVALLTLPVAPSAQAGDILTEMSAGRKYALQSKAASDEAGKPVCASAQTEDAGNQAGKLRARTDCGVPGSLGARETFTLHTGDKGARAALRSEANGLYVSAEFHDTDTHFGMLRARQDGSIGNWEQFRTVDLNDGWFALQYTFTEGGVSRNYYVSAEINSNGGDEGLLRARATTTPGSWERFKLLRIDSPSRPPAAASTPKRSIQALTWNTCSNNGACAMNEFSDDAFADAVVQRAADARADVIFLQEFCEKLAKPLEHRLEARFDGGADTWDVRFAPIQHQMAGTKDQWAQKSCGRNRGAYGVAIAVPAGNTWYEAVELESPAGKERRTALCAAVPSWAVMACTAHFSTGGADYDDPERDDQQAQASYLAEQAAEYAGYRPVLGGDLNASPTMTPEGSSVPVLQPLYDLYKECDQPANRLTTANHKLDYIFAPGTATWSGCALGSSAANPSDHIPLSGTVTLPAR